MKDQFLTPELLPRWQSIFPAAHIEKLPCGHYSCEEAAKEVEASVYLFMDGHREMHAPGEAIMGFD